MQDAGYQGAEEDRDLGVERERREEVREETERKVKKIYNVSLCIFCFFNANQFLTNL